MNEDIEDTLSIIRLAADARRLPVFLFPLFFLFTFFLCI